jgi:hypothetical protein
MLHRVPEAIQGAHESLQSNPTDNIRAHFVLFKCHLLESDNSKGNLLITAYSIELLQPESRFTK